MIDELARITGDIIKGLTVSDLVENIYGDDYLGGWVFYVNEKQGVTVVRNEAINRKCVIRLSEGDKFDVYTGVCIGLFRLLTGIPYWRLNRLISQFAPCDAEHDSTAKFICAFIHDALGIDRKWVEDEYALAKKNAKGDMCTFGCVIKPVQIGRDEADEDEPDAAD